LQELQTSFPCPVSTSSAASGPEAAEAEVPPRVATAAAAARRAMAFLMGSMM
jgi:hypothetical protein